MPGTRGKKKHELEGKREPGENSLVGMKPQAGPWVQVKDWSESTEKTRTRSFTAWQTQIFSGEPEQETAPCANTQMVDLGAKPATAMLKKAPHSNPSPSNAEGEISKHQEGTVWSVHSSRRRFASIYSICAER